MILAVGTTTISVIKVIIKPQVTTMKQHLSLIHI